MTKKDSNWKYLKEKLATKWSEKVTPSNVWQEYPRPQATRDEWLNLNGLWDFCITNRKANRPSDFPEKILVPFPIESSLSGVKRKLKPSERIWYRKFFTIPSKWSKKRVMLHFGAVDYKASVYFNDRLIYTHHGGHTAFSVELTGFLRDGENELIIGVWDPSSRGVQAKGKQMLNPFFIFYTAVSGIWQTVWLEMLPESFIGDFRLIPDIDNNKLYFELDGLATRGASSLKFKVKDKNKEVSFAEGKNFERISIDIPDPKLWSPENPFLYDLEIELYLLERKVDTLKSYFGMRKVDVQKASDGYFRIHLNNEPLFQYGLLDQGYWPDGLYTAPSDDAFIFDIKKAKELGFNMLRKHVKIEPARWYYHCDRLGILVWQDMPSGGRLMMFGGRRERKRKYYRYELIEMMKRLYNSPAIVVWVPFNEGWGQFKTKDITEVVKAYDPTRLVDSASGWYDKKTGDIKDIHSYPGPKMPQDNLSRALVLGEFGGLGLHISGHTWSKKKGWSYKKSQNYEILEQKYQSLLTELKPMIKNGLSAAVYTQISDVEKEINGLFTYDRKVLKIRKEKLQQLHDELFNVLLQKK